MKRIFAFAVLLMTLILCCAAGAETTVNNTDFAPPQIVEYVGGGVIFRTSVRSDDASGIEVAYWDFDMPYILLGEEALWEIVIEGGKEPYTINVNLYRQFLSDTSNYYSYYDTLAESNDTEVKYTFQEEGKYLLMINITDAAGQQVVLQTKMIPVYAQEIEDDVTTVPGKINSIIKSEISDNMDDYHRALALHDWLVTNAEYDYSYTYFEPDGVLLYGLGVCDSFAQAYRMLMNAAGVECIYVSGTSGDDRHAWNLVKIDDDWYHVDCTWDVGGSHEYFMLTDEQIEPTHTWIRDAEEENIANDNIVPDAEGGEYTKEDDGSDIDYYEFIAYDVDDLTAKFRDLIVTGKYEEVYFSNKTGLGLLDLSSWAGEQNTWLYQNGIACNIDYVGAVSTGSTVIALTWSEKESYILIKEKDVELVIGQSVQLHVARVYSVDGTYTISWKTSDPSVATVDQNGLVTAVSDGYATISASIVDSQADVVNVTVLPAFSDEFDLEDNIEGSTLVLTWDRIPGVTEYQVCKRVNGVETILETVSDTQAVINRSELSANGTLVYVVARRVVQGEVVLSYMSETLCFGVPEITYQCYMPAVLRAIEDSAFRNTNIGNVYIPSGVERIGASAFADCRNLQAIRLPVSVSNIGSGAFSGSALIYAVVSEGSYSHTYMQENYPGVTLIFE